MGKIPVAPSLCTITQLLPYNCHTFGTLSPLASPRRVSMYCTHQHNNTALTLTLTLCQYIHRYCIWCHFTFGIRQNWKYHVVSSHNSRLAAATMVSKKDTLALFALAFIVQCNALYFHIGETERKCFIEEIPDETTVLGECRLLSSTVT